MNPPLRGVTLREAAVAKLDMRLEAEDEARIDGDLIDDPGVDTGLAPLAVEPAPDRSTRIGVGGLLLTGLYKSKGENEA